MAHNRRMRDVPSWFERFGFTTRPSTKIPTPTGIEHSFDDKVGPAVSAGHVETRDIQ
jgi:hypothetical protein